MQQADIAGLKNPAMAYLFESVVGKWGAIFINLGLVISVLGAWLVGLCSLLKFHI